jgi:hypothetical protein
MSTNSSLSSESEEIDTAALEYIITHIFCPIKLPQNDDYTAKSDCALLNVVLCSARNFVSFLPDNDQEQWGPLLKMLENLGTTTISPSLTKDIGSQIRSMRGGGMCIVVEN